MTRISILVINPNSTQSITDSLEDLFPKPYPDPDVSLSFFTAPSESPPSIDGEATSQLSTTVCLPLLLPLIAQHSAFLVACYSEHPLVNILAEHSDGKPVLGIFEASVLHSIGLLKSRPDIGKFGIVTTGKIWEQLLSDGVRHIVSLSQEHDEAHWQIEDKFAGVQSTSLSAIELHSTSAGEVQKRIREASKDLVRKGAGVICMGCAGMSGMEEAVIEGARSERPDRDTIVIDAVKVGVDMLIKGLQK